MIGCRYSSPSNGRNGDISNLIWNLLDVIDIADPSERRFDVIVTLLLYHVSAGDEWMQIYCQELGAV